MKTAHSILFDARLVLEKPTGIGQYIASLLPEMIDAAPDLHFHVLHRPTPWPGYGLTKLNATNLSLHVCQVPHMSLKQHQYLPQMTRELQADLLHYPHFDAPVLWPQVIGRSVPVVATIHDLKYLVHPEYLPDLGYLKRHYMRFAFGQTVRRADAVIAVSKSTREDLLRLFRPKEDNIQVVYEATDARFGRLTSEEQPLNETYGISRPYILSVGECRPHKNHVRLVTAFGASAAAQTHDLVVIGQDHRGYQEPQEVAERHQLADRVHFLHDVELENLIRFYVNADLFILVSLYEGFGLPLLEAGACGVPIIASSTTATGEIAGDGALQVDPTDVNAIASAMDRILQSDTLRNDLSQRSQQRAAEFSWRRAALETIAIYREVINKHDSRV